MSCFFSGISFQREREWNEKMPKEREKDISFDKMRAAPSHAFADNVWCRLSFLILHSSFFSIFPFFFDALRMNGTIHHIFFISCLLIFLLFFCFAVRKKEKSTFWIRSSVCILCSWFLYCVFIVIEQISHALMGKRNCYSRARSRSVYLHFGKNIEQFYRVVRVKIIEHFMYNG